VFHVMDDTEITFPFERMTRFEGLEGLGDLVVNPRSLREGYLKEVEKFMRTIRRGCTANRIDYVLLNTATPLDVALSSYLAKRSGTR
jgi:hypothetical protein